MGHVGLSPNTKKKSRDMNLSDSLKIKENGKLVHGKSDHQRLFCNINLWNFKEELGHVQRVVFAPH